MRIVYITQRLPFGSGETFIVPEINALLAAGHEVLIVPRVSQEPVQHDDVGPLLLRTQVLPGNMATVAAVASTFAQQPGRSLRTVGRLCRTRPWRRGLSNLVATAQGMWVARLARAWGADHIHAHWAHLTATLAMSASAVSGIPWSFTAHRYDIVLNNLLAEKLRSARFGRFIARETLALARSLVPSDALARAVVLHMGVALPVRPLLPAAISGTPVVLCPARLIAVKGHVYLLEAAARLRARKTAFELWLAGEGPEIDMIRQRIAALELDDRVRLLGNVPHGELLRLYQQEVVHCVVLPSIELGGGLHEGISVALIEAMAYGIPTVGTRTGGLPELLEDGAGVLVPPADSATLADELERVLGSVQLRAELGRAGRERIEQEFDVVATARELARHFAGERPLAQSRVGTSRIAVPQPGLR